MRKIMVIGGSGFIGHHLIRKRIAEGGCRVVSVDILPPRERIVGVEYVIHDVRHLSSLEGHADTNVIYNFAAVHTTPGHAYWEYFDTNVRGATEVINFAKKHEIKSIVFTSSILIYGPNEEIKDENSLPEPNSAYGWSKLLSEGVFEAWFKATDDAKLMIVRPAVVFGEGERGNFTRLAKLLSRGLFVYPGRRDTIKACIYVKDLLHFMDAMWEKEARYSLFNGCYAERYELQQVVFQMKQHFSKVREVTVPAFAMLIAAKLLAALPNSIGVHPERILKLIRSTNIYPGVLVESGLMNKDPLAEALDDWFTQNHGSFE